jgi:hypothetical protein
MRGLWNPTGKLRTGDSLRTADGTDALALAGTTPKISVGWMWDLTISNDHDFYVVAGNTAVLVHNCGVDPYQVGTYKDLKASSKSGDGLDIHHVPQGQPAGQAIPGYDYPNAPAIALPRAEHAQIPNLRGVYNGTSQDLIAQDFDNLNNFTNAPQSSIDQLTNLIDTLYPGAR